MRRLDKEHLRPISALSAALLASLPGIAFGNDMAGLALVVAAILVGAPIAIVLVGSILASLVFGRKPARWHRTYATVTTVGAVLFTLAFPIAVAFLGGDKFVGVALVLDLPVVALAAVAVLLARRAGKRAPLT